MCALPWRTAEELSDHISHLTAGTLALWLVLSTFSLVLPPFQVLGNVRKIRTFTLPWGISHLLGVLRDGSIFERYSGNWIQAFVHAECTVLLMYINLVRSMVTRMSGDNSIGKGWQSFPVKGQAVTLVGFVDRPVLNTSQCSLCRLQSGGCDCAPVKCISGG